MQSLVGKMMKDQVDDAPGVVSLGPRLIGYGHRPPPRRTCKERSGIQRPIARAGGLNMRHRTAGMRLSCEAGHICKQRLTTRPAGLVAPRGREAGGAMSPRSWRMPDRGPLAQ